MRRAAVNDLDYLAARLHARRARMAEGGRLGDLCGLNSLQKLSMAIFPDAEMATTADFQRRLTELLVAEIYRCLNHLDGADQYFTEWLLTRFQVENAKVLLRGFLNHTPLERLRLHLISLPHGFDLAAAELLAAQSLEEFAARLPAGRPRARLLALLADELGGSRGFLLEAALDAGYLQELLARSNAIRSRESEILGPLVLQEVNLFQFLLVMRGRFHFGLNPNAVKAMRVVGANADWLKAVYAAPDVLSAAKLVLGLVIDTPPVAGEKTPVELAQIEALGWQRYLRLANRAFRSSHNGIAAVAGYFGLRRLEIANLTAISDGIRLGASKRETREHLLPRSAGEVAHV